MQRPETVINNNWKLSSVVEDKGGCPTPKSDFDSDCCVARDGRLSGPSGSPTQHIVAWRTDNSTAITSTYQQEKFCLRNEKDI